MMTDELEVAVMDGEALVQRWLCRRTAMPDGAPGVLWRGVAYPLLSGDRIDVGLTPLPEPANRHAVLPGDEASWVLIQGMPAGLDAARKALESDGIVVLRTGRWMGEPIEQVSFDWFLRCEGRIDEPRVTELLGRSTPTSVETDSAVRLAVLEQRIAGLLADVARAQDGLRLSLDARRAPQVDGLSPPAPVADSESNVALQSALAEIDALHASIESIGAGRPRNTHSELEAPQTVRARDEVTGLLAALRPDILLIRDSLLIAFGEFHSRNGFYKALGELPTSGSRPEGWKMLRGAERWWECHVSTGRNDHGRVYAKFDTAARRWSILLSWKADQQQDIAWLKRQVC